MKKIIERFRWWLGFKLIQTENMTAIGTMVMENAKRVRCINCGKSPFTSISQSSTTGFYHQKDCVTKKK